MIEIKDLLLKFNNLLVSEEVKKNTIIEIIIKITGIKIPPKDLKIKNNDVYLNIKPIHKNEIFLKKDLIFSQLEEALGKKHPKNIR